MNTVYKYNITVKIQIFYIVAIWSDIPEYSSIYIGVASLSLLCNSSVEEIRSLPSSHFV